MSTFLLSIMVCILSFMNQNDPVGTRPQPSPNFGLKPTASKISCSDLANAKELPPPGPACEKELFARRGKPYKFPARDGIAFGVSSEPDKPSTLHLWVENQTEETVNLHTCCGQTLYEHIDIYASDGHRILSKVDQDEEKA
jgi:hypothetical protein